MNTWIAIFHDVHHVQCVVLVPEVFVVGWFRKLNSRKTGVFERKKDENDE